MAEPGAPGPRVLVVEDDEEVAAVLQQILSDERYDVEVRGSLFQARGAVERSLPDLIILDRRLPDGDGIEFCRELRRAPRTRGVSVLFLTGTKKGVPDKVLGLEGGADDYITKPFSSEELLARVKAVLRRAMNAAERPDVLEAGPLRVEPEARKAFLFQAEVLLRPKEYNVLLAFMECRGRVLSRAFLLQRAWGLDKDLELSTNVVDVTVGSLRRKLGAYGCAICSVHSYGFRFDADKMPVPPAPPSAALLSPSPKKPKRPR